MRAGLRGSAAPNLSKAAPNIRRCFCVKASEFTQLYLFDLSIWGRRMIGVRKIGGQHEQFGKFRAGRWWT